jgi:hypothetical protein
MATWGAYFASYVKKPKEDASTIVTPATTNDVSQIAAPKAVVKASTVKSTASTDGFQRSNSTAKKLYEIPTEFPKELPQRSTSNAARVAKLFGYAKPPPVEGKLAGVVAEMVVADAKMKEEGKKSEIIASLFGERGSIVNDQAKTKDDARTKETPSSKVILGLPPDPVTNAMIVAGKPPATARMDDQAVRVSQNIQTTPLMIPPSQTLPERQSGDTTPVVLETKPNLTIASRATDFAPMPWAKVAEESITQISKKPAGQTKQSISKLDNDIKTMLDTFASQAPKLTSSEPQQSKLHAENPVLPIKYEEVMESKVYTQARIKSFTSQAKTMYPPESEPSKLLEKTTASITTSQFRNVTASKTKNDTQAMLNLFASQAQALESVDDMFSENSATVKSKVEAKVDDLAPPILSD